MVTQTRTDATTVFRALGDPTRRAILTDLRAGAKPVNAIAERFALTRPAVSRHLRVLRRARLVVARRDGRHRIFALNDEPLETVDAWLADFRTEWRERLGRLKRHVEAGSRRTP
ncbi:MAG: ArsR/SmtB family transcription factor [Gemmatimonadales bacterium]